jgi:CRP-like cAMP-binding protein
MVELAAVATPTTVTRKQWLWRQGEHTEHLTFIRSGVIRIGMTAPGDRDVTLHLCGRHDVIGFSGLSGISTRPTWATALEDGICYQVATSHLAALLRQFPTVTHALLQLTQRRRISVANRLARVAHATVQGRVAAVLLELAEQFGVPDSRGTIINLRLTHRELASMVGATRESVSFAVLALRKDGLIEAEQKRVTLLRPRELAQLD